MRASDRNSNPALDRKTRAILAYLAATGRPHSRQSLYSLFCQEALDLAREAKRTQVEFSALVLSIRLRLALREIDVPTAIRELEALGAEWPGEHEQAALHYELWHLQPDPALSRRHAAAAVELYHTLYHRTHWIDDRRRYEELSGEALPDLPPLPAPPPIVTADPVDLAALLAQVDQITAELKA